MKAITNIFICVLGAVGCLFFILGLLTKDVGTLSISIFLVWGMAFLSAYVNGKNLTYLFFLSTFFIFLLSRVMVRWIRFQEIYTPFSYDTMVMIYACLFLSLMGLTLGNITSNIKCTFWKNRLKNNSIEDSASRLNMPLLRQVAAIFTYTCGFATLAVVIEKAAFWGITGYGGDLRIFYVSTLPDIILRLSYAYVLMLCIYLATMPTKRQCIWVFAQYIVVSALKLMYGSRSDFIVGLMFMLLYFSIRDRLNIEKETNAQKWIGKNEKVFTVVSIPLLIILTVFIGSYRQQTSFQFSSFLETLGDFAEAQGSSINVIGYTEVYQDKFTQPKFLYLFDETYEFLTTNPLGSILTGRHAYAANTIERAEYGTSLGMTLYYHINKVSYLAGNGCGSSYVAEGWLGYGYFGLFVINFLLARVMAKANRYKYSRFVPSVITLLFLQSLFFMPRNNFDAFVGEMSGISNLLLAFMLWIVYKLLNRRSLTT